MKIIATKENLLTGIQTVQKAISNKNTIPVLSGILLTAKNNKLLFAATDLEIGIECKVSVQIVEEGQIILPARYFAELVRKLPDTKIIIEYLPEIVGVKIQYDDAEINIKGWDGEEFPVIPDLNDDYSFNIAPTILKTMVKQTIFCVAIDDGRPIFTGALLEKEDDNLKIITTDTHRLALRQGKISNFSDTNISIIVPGKTLNEVSRIIKDEDEVLNIRGNSNQICFETDDTRIISRIIEGKFPNYRQVIPEDFQTVLKIKKKSFQETIERANLFSNEKDGTSILKVNISEDVLQVTSKSEIGKVDEKIPIYLQGESLEITFNAKYLIDALKVIDFEDINITFGGSLNPAVIRPLNNDNYLYLLLPLRTS